MNRELLRGKKGNDISENTLWLLVFLYMPRPSNKSAAMPPRSLADYNARVAK
jgi:hypothetical protein